MKNLLVISIIITVFLRGISGDWVDPCTILLDEPIILCDYFDELTIMPYQNNTYIPTDFTAMEISYISSLYLPDIQVSTVSVQPADEADSSVTMNLRPELFDKMAANALVVQNVNCPATENPFRHLKSVKRVQWRNNVFKNIKDDIFAGFPLLEQLFWTDEKLTIISPTLFSNINEGLRELQVKGRISDIEPDSFARLKRLRNLQLKSSRLRLLRDDMFRGLDILDELDLSECEIESIEAGTFHGLPLRHLDLSSNKISNIAPELFLNFTSLKFLYLDHNKLQALPSGVFRSTNDLVYLLLNNNQIKNISTGTFQNFFQLSKLDLSDNQIDYIQPGAFANSHITDLILNNNEIKQLENDTFKGLRLAQFLELNGNNITAIEPKAFEKIQVCRTCPATVKLENLETFPGVLSSKWHVYHHGFGVRRNEENSDEKKLKKSPLL